MIILTHSIEARNAPLSENKLAPRDTAELINLFRKNAQLHIESIDSLINSALERSEKLEKVVYIEEKANLYFKNRKFDLADSLFNCCISCWIDLNRNKELGTCYFRKGLTSSRRNDSKGVLENFQKAIFEYESLGYKKGVVYAQMQIAIFFSKHKNFNVAEKRFNYAVAEANDSRDTSLITIASLNLGHFLLERKKFNESLRIYQKVQVEENKYISSKNLAVVYNNLAIIYENKELLAQTEYYLKRSIEIKEKNSDYQGVILSKLNLLNIYIKSSQYDNALLIKSEIESQINSVNSSSRLDYYFNLFFLYSKIGESKKSIESFDKYIAFKDSLSNAAFSDKLIEMQKGFELKEKDQEIAILQKEDALNKAHLKTKNILIGVTASFLLILLVVGYLINRQRKELAQSRRRLMRQKEDISGMNEQLRVSNLAKDRILAVIGHDLRGPVGGLKELIELYMELPEYEPNDIDNLLKAAREASTSTYHLLENLLSWANSQRGDIVYSPVATPIAPLVKQSVNLLDKSINTRNVSFKFDIPEALVMQVDLNMLRTIIRNLVSNALKYSPENGTITLGVDNKEGKVQFSVCDQGKGMTADETQSIFKKKETYFIGSELTAKGTGLGLILCKEFVERHGGSIWIDSELGVGTKVCFTIPQKKTKSNEVEALQSVGAQ